MEYLTTNPNVGRFEDLIQEPSLTVRHLVLHTDEDIPEHLSRSETVVVIFKGKVEFCGTNGAGKHVLTPGVIVHMLPDEPHALHALEDSELIVVKAQLA